MKIINQLNKMNLLNDEDKKRIKEWKKKIIPQINTSSPQYKLSSIINRLKTYTNYPEIQQIYENNKQHSNFSYSEKYDQTIKQEIYDLINQKSKENSYSFHFLGPNFEKYFINNGFRTIIKKGKEKYGENKVLLGEFLAEQIKVEDIPQEISSIMS